MRSKSSQNVVNIINFVTFLVIVIGSAALFIVLSGFAGLKTFSLSFSQRVDPDLMAQPATGKFFSLTSGQEKELAAIPGVANYAKEMEERVYLIHEQKNSIAYIKGIDENFASVTGMDSTLYYGSWLVDKDMAVAGIGIANLLGLTTNDFRSPLTVLVPKPGKGSLTQGMGVLNQQNSLYNEMPLVLSGVYAVEENLDKKYVLADLGLVQHLLQKDSTQVSGVDFKLDPQTDPLEIRKQIGAILGDQVVLKDRRELNSTLYRMLNTENLATYLIFTLVLIIALFNVVGAIIMMILDKQQNSRTLFSLGTTIKELQRIYFVQGLLVTGFGGLIGVVLGSLLIASQMVFGWLRITPSLAYPVEFKITNVVLVLATILVLGAIAARIASSRINKRLLTVH